MNAAKVESLRRELRGIALLPGDDNYVKYTTAWNLNAKQFPAIVVVAESKDDIVTAIRFARENDLGVGVMATGHGVGKSCNGGLLINTSLMRNVTIDPGRRTATVDAGALWSDVIAKASEHGLATLAGSAPHVGVVGYTMGGGFGYLGRKFGLNSASVVKAEVVTAEGVLRTANENENVDLFWGIKGGGGNFGIVASLEFRLYPITKVYGGAVYYPIEQDRKALEFFSIWSANLPDDFTVAFAFMNVPDVPAAPAALRGKSLVTIKGCYCGDNLEEGEEIFTEARKVAKPIADTFGVMDVKNMDAISKDPVDPMGILQYGTLLKDLSDPAIDAIVQVAGQHSSSPLQIVELRRLGGKLNHGTDIKMMGEGKAAYSLNAIGGTFNDEMVARVQGHLDKMAIGIRSHSTDEVFLNFLEVDPNDQRVRQAYTRQDWQRLVHLKKMYDNRDTFRFNRRVANDIQH